MRLQKTPGLIFEASKRPEIRSRRLAGILRWSPVPGGAFPTRSPLYPNRVVAAATSTDAGVLEKLYGIPSVRIAPRRRMHEFCNHVARRGLRVGDRFVNAVDWAARYVVPPAIAPDRRQRYASPAPRRRGHQSSRGCERESALRENRSSSAHSGVVQALGEAGELSIVADRKCDTARRYTRMRDRERCWDDRCRSGQAVSPLAR